MCALRRTIRNPKSNGKLERWNKSIKSECIRPGVPLSHDDAKRLVVQYVQVYNEQRLHSSIGYITPKDMLEGGKNKFMPGVTASWNKLANSVKKLPDGDLIHYRKMSPSR